jgi:hypothetical protein
MENDMQRRRTLVGMVAVTVLALGGTLVTTRAHAKSAWAKPAVDTPDAIAALQKMGAFLRAQQAFTVKSQQTTDDVMSSGQKVQYSGNVVLKVRRPDRMSMTIDTDRRKERIYYDGKTFTVFGEKNGYYAQFQAPPTLNDLKAVLEKRGIDMPLADLFYWGTEQDGTAKIKTATLVGTSNINGVPCDHYAIRQADIDWEIWIEQGPRTLPHKIAITTITERTQPQHIMTLDWDLAPRLTEDQFAFSPPPNSHRIEFEQVKGKGGAQ